MASIWKVLKIIGLLIGATIGALIIKIGGAILTVVGIVASFLFGTALIAGVLYLLGTLLIEEFDEEKDDRS